MSSKTASAPIQLIRYRWERERERADRAIARASEGSLWVNEGTFQICVGVATDMLRLTPSPCVCVCARARVCVCVCACTCIHTGMCTCIHTGMFCTHVPMHVGVHTCTHNRTLAQTKTRTHTTQTHTGKDTDTVKDTDTDIHVQKETGRESACVGWD